MKLYRVIQQDVSISGGDIIGHCEKIISYDHLSNSERLQR